MSNVFAHQNYSDLANSDLENNARLALHIALHLRETQQTPDGSWPAPHIGAMLRHTCHAIEALHLLNWQAYKRTIRMGVDWLLNLSDWSDPYEDDQGSIKYHPSRFKTLAWLGHFFNSSVLEDFAYLSQCINEEGLTFNIIDKQILGSIIYVDCLTLLDTDQVAPAWQQNADAALVAIERALRHWCDQHNGEAGKGLITSLSDASYGLDLLLRIGQLTQESAITEQIYGQMCDQVETPLSRSNFASDILYCAIQLANHFGERERTKQALRLFFTNLRSYYDSFDPAMDGRIAALHPLVLRGLIVYGGKDLCDQMLARLLNREYEVIRQAQSLAEARIEIFEALIRRKTRITIIEVEPLSGGITDARIFRVSYELGIESLLEPTTNNHSKLTPPSIVVRSDTPEAIHQAVKQYQRLPIALQHLFARHAGEPLIFEAKMEAPAFLILEDLTTNYNTFRYFFDALDRAHITNDNRAALRRACQTLTHSLGILYTATQKESKEFLGNQLARLYFNAFERYLIRLTSAADLRRLKPFFDGFWLTERVHFSSFEYYQSRLEHHRDKLRVPSLMLVHGDLHARNVMLDECQTKLKLIDLDKLHEYGDYILDYAQLIEDIGAFRFLFDENNRRYLRTDQIEFSTTQNMITYPPLGTAATLLFQEWLLEELASFALVNEDHNWQHRLWLGIALHLMSLINKARDIQHAAVLYVEAIRLLDELVQSLDSDFPLPLLPFRSEHPSDEFPDPTDLTQQHLLLPLHEKILALQTEINQLISVDMKPSGKVMRYFVQKTEPPFAVIDGKKNPPKVLLRNTDESLDDPRGLVQTAGGGLFQRFITIDKPTDLQYVADVVAQVLRRLLPTNGNHTA